MEFEHVGFDLSLAGVPTFWETYVGTPGRPMGHMPNNEWDDDKVSFGDDKPDVWHEYRCTR